MQSAGAICNSDLPRTQRPAVDALMTAASDLDSIAHGFFRQPYVDSCLSGKGEARSML